MATETKGRRKKKKANVVQEFLDGSLTGKLVEKQSSFLIFLSILAFVYIANRYKTENIIREIVKTQKEIKELRSESISITSELMYLSNQTEVSKLLKANGYDLKESTEPPIIIEVEKQTDE